jgi:hypothetical protein
MRYSASSWIFNTDISGDIQVRHSRGRWDVYLNSHKVLHIETVPGKFYLSWKNPSQGIQQLKNFIDRFFVLTRIERYRTSITENTILIEDIPSKKVHVLQFGGPVVTMLMPVSALFHIHDRNCNQGWYPRDAVAEYEATRGRKPETFF